MGAYLNASAAELVANFVCGGPIAQPLNLVPLGLNGKNLAIFEGSPIAEAPNEAHPTVTRPPHF